MALRLLRAMIAERRGRWRRRAGGKALLSIGDR